MIKDGLQELTGTSVQRSWALGIRSRPSHWMQSPDSTYLLMGERKRRASSNNQTQNQLVWPQWMTWNVSLFSSPVYDNLSSVSARRKQPTVLPVTWPPPSQTSPQCPCWPQWWESPSRSASSSEMWRFAQGPPVQEGKEVLGSLCDWGRIPRVWNEWKDTKEVYVPGSS